MALWPPGSQTAAQLQSQVSWATSTFYCHQIMFYLNWFCCIALLSFYEKFYHFLWIFAEFFQMHFLFHLLILFWFLSFSLLFLIRIFLLCLSSSLHLWSFNSNYFLINITSLLSFHICNLIIHSCINCLL